MTEEKREQKEIMFDKEFTCCFSGHRLMPTNFNKQYLKEIIIRMIELKNVYTYLVGMALGFDTICFQVLEEVRKTYPIKIVACVPCPNQSARFLEHQKKEYDRMLKEADKIIYTSDKYTQNCYFIRNEFMVDNSEYLVCYLREKFGGTFRTVNYAEKKNRIIVKL